MAMSMRYLALAALIVAAGCDSTTDPHPGVPAAVLLSTHSVTFDAFGSESMLGAIVLDGNGSVLTVPLTWSSSDIDVATVSTGGKVTSVSNGTAVITVQAESVSDEATVTVAQVADSVTVEATEVELPGVGDTTRIVWEVLDRSGNEVVDGSASFASSDEGVATVSADGVITAVAVGSAVVTVGSGPAETEISVTVVGPLLRAAFGRELTAAAGGGRGG